MVARKGKRYRVSGYDLDDDLHAFETDSRERAEHMKLQMQEDLKDVELEALRLRP